ncbi:DUF979 domain-containing protein [Xylocopilactobacillus apicola]|uniref:Permease n=1 Tax=Xylocopilactobacillus apicola TaxID=2932184 RepID=A0AAU9DP99_9LACO|nr:DUF979 domain-containing protein [Xylocopilactobacillus apicola]BDR58962.1 permease [Xylocopilactobacillus apicola]
MASNLLMFFYALVGVCLAIAAQESFKDEENPARIGTGIFWLILAIIFAFGNFIPKKITGFLVLVIGVLALFKQIKVGTIEPVDGKHAAQFAKKLGGWIFLPSIVLAVVAICIGSFTKLGGQVAVGFGAVISLIVAMVETKAPVKMVYNDTQRMIRSVGTAGILPQLLATLGAVFTAAGVGDLTAKLISGAFPPGNRLFGVILYCISMALFTIIMGNAFAAFAIITAAVGIPFVVAQGGNPAVVAALGMTSGYCGTLVTPMAANFNSLPVALLDMDDQMGVIKQQLPIAAILLLAHIILMYFLAF